MKSATREPVLVVEGDESMRRRLCDYLGQLGYAVDGAGSLGEAIQMALTRPYAAAVLDVTIGPGTGEAAVSELQLNQPKMPVIVMSGAPSVRAVIAALRQGAFDYIIKPYEIQDLATILPRAVERGRQELAALALTGGAAPPL